MDYLFKGRLGHSWGHHNERPLVWGGHTMTGQSSGVGVGNDMVMPPQYDPGSPQSPYDPVTIISPHMQPEPKFPLPEPERVNGFFTGRTRR